jgi:hypothetical protein
MRSNPVSLLILATLAGCGGYAYDEALSGSYRLVAVDELDNMIVCRRFAAGDCIGDELPGPSVFAAGANSHYVTIARHPMAPGSPPEKSVTEYYYVIRHTDRMFLHDGDVVGSLNEAQFDVAKDRLQLPAFSKVLSALR